MLKILKYRYFLIGAILYKKLSINNLQLNYSRFADLWERNNLPAIVNNISAAYQTVKSYRGERNNLFIIHCSRINYMEWHQLPFVVLFYIGCFFIVAEFCRATAAEEVPKVRQELADLLKKLEQQEGEGNGYSY